MANKLAGQRAKFSRARAIHYMDGDPDRRSRAAELMAEVLRDAPANGFGEDLVTQGEDVPDEVRIILARGGPAGGGPTNLEDEEAEAERYVSALADTVDLDDIVTLGDGPESVYAYGYGCSPDRLKIGSCTGDVVARVAAQIGTGTPDKPALRLILGTHDCRALERALQYTLRLRGRKVDGAGAEWFVASREEVIAVYRAIADEGPAGTTEEP